MSEVPLYTRSTGTGRRWIWRKMIQEGGGRMMMPEWGTNQRRFDPTPATPKFEIHRDVGTEGEDEDDGGKGQEEMEVRPEPWTRNPKRRWDNMGRGG